MLVALTPPIPVTTSAPSATSAPEKAGGDTKSTGATSGAGSGPAVPDADTAVQGDSEASRPVTAQANSKEKTPMCLVNELARYNKVFEC